jgi:serine/threonine-protein kinase RsbT
VHSDAANVAQEASMIPMPGSSSSSAPIARGVPDLLFDRIEVSCEEDVHHARMRIDALAYRLDVSDSERLVLRAAVSELTRNVARHAGRGEILIGRVPRGRAEAIVIVARDRGPGIADVHRAERQGLGLSGVRRLMDQLSIDTAPGRGTTITAIRTVGTTARSRMRAA